MFEKRPWAQPNFNNGIRDRGLKQQPRLGSKEPVNDAVWLALLLEVVKLAAVSQNECHDTVEELVTAKAKVRVTLRPTVSQSAHLDVEPHADFNCCLKATGFSLLGALSDERAGMSFVSHSQQYKSFMCIIFVNIYFFLYGATALYEPWPP
jgi:hypothetical protein